MVARISTAREGFRSGYKGSGSNIDTEVELKRFLDIVNYIPRAIQIGFLAPFPSQWIEQGNVTGKVGRMIAGAETLLWYLLAFGSLFCLWKCNDIWVALSVNVVISILVIMLLGFVVTNVGAMYRMRIGFFIPFYILGVYGLHSILRYYRSEKA
jgi:hypothetical protein